MDDFLALSAPVMCSYTVNLASNALACFCAGSFCLLAFVPASCMRAFLSACMRAGLGKEVGGGGGGRVVVVVAAVGRSIIPAHSTIPAHIPIITLIPLAFTVTTVTITISNSHSIIVLIATMKRDDRRGLVVLPPGMHARPEPAMSTGPDVWHPPPPRSPQGLPVPSPRATLFPIRPTIVASQGRVTAVVVGGKGERRGEVRRGSASARSGPNVEVMPTALVTRVGVKDDGHDKGMIVMHDDGESVTSAKVSVAPTWRCIDRGEEGRTTVGGIGGRR